MPEAAANTVPAEAWERVSEALSRSWKYLPATAQQKLAELKDPATLKALAVLLLVWAGAHLVGVGEIADLVGLILAAWEGIRVAGVLLEAVQTAYNATTDAQLERAGQLFAQSMTDVLIDALVALFGSFVFKRLRDGLEYVRVRFSGSPKGTTPRAEPTGKATDPVEGPTKKNNSFIDYAKAGGVALGATTGAVAVGQFNSWGLLAGIAGLAGVGLLIAAAVSHRSSSRRRAYAA